MNKNMTKFLLLVIILLFTLGVASATDNTTTHTKDTTGTALEKTTPTVEKVVTKTETITNNKKGNETKTITKKEENNLKKEVQTIILNNENYNEYVTNSYFNDKVNSGDTIDIQGILTGSDAPLEINKPVNIVSSTNDGTINFGRENIFSIVKSGAGTNISDIHFTNTPLQVINSTDVKINNITLFNGAIAGQGCLSVREGSNNITVTNSYFKTQGNGGISNVVFAAAYNSLFENNTIEGYGDQGLIGNLLYLTTYNVKTADYKTNENITIRNNKISSYYTWGYGTCWGIVLEGTGHIIENNYVDTAVPITSQYSDASYDFETNIGGIIVKNNTFTYHDYNSRTTSSSQMNFPGIVTNNTIMGKAIFKQNTVYNNVLEEVEFQDKVINYNNTFNKLSLGNNIDINLENNDLISFNINGENNTVSNIKLNSNTSTTINGNNNNITNASINTTADFVIGGSNNIITYLNLNSTSQVIVSGSNNKITNSTILSDKAFAIALNSNGNHEISNNYIVSSMVKGDSAVSNPTGNIVENNTPEGVGYVEITDDTYYDYFDEKGNIINIPNGAVISFKGNFNNKNFTFENVQHILTMSGRYFYNSTIIINGTSKLTILGHMIIENSYGELRNALIMDSDNNYIERVTVYEDNTKSNTTSLIINGNNNIFDLCFISGQIRQHNEENPSNLGIIIEGSNNQVNVDYYVHNGVGNYTGVILTPESKNNTLIGQHLPYNPQGTRQIAVLISGENNRLTNYLTNAQIILNNSNNAVLNGLRINSKDTVLILNNSYNNIIENASYITSSNSKYAITIINSSNNIIKNNLISNNETYSGNNAVYSDENSKNNIITKNRNTLVNLNDETYNQIFKDNRVIDANIINITDDLHNKTMILEDGVIVIGNNYTLYDSPIFVETTKDTVSFNDLKINTNNITTALTINGGVSFKNVEIDMISQEEVTAIQSDNISSNIEGLTININSPIATAIKITNSSNQKIQNNNINITSNNGNAIELTNVKQYTITNNKINTSSQEHPIVIKYSDNVTITGNTIENPEYMGGLAIESINSELITITNNLPKTTIQLTNTNYNEYFQNGFYVGGSDIVELASDLYNRDLTFDKEVIFNGNNYTIYNGTMTIQHSSVTINNVKINNTDDRPSSLIFSGVQAKFTNSEIYQKGDNKETVIFNNFTGLTSVFRNNKIIITGKNSTALLFKNYYFNSNSFNLNEITVTGEENYAIRILGNGGFNPTGLRINANNFTINQSTAFTPILCDNLMLTFTDNRVIVNSTQGNVPIIQVLTIRQGSITNNYIESPDLVGNHAVDTQTTNTGNLPLKIMNLTDDNYDNYFEDGKLVGVWDRIYLGNDIHNKNMTINSSIIFDGENYTIFNGTVNLLNGGTLTNVTIFNGTVNLLNGGTLTNVTINNTQNVSALKVTGSAVISNNRIYGESENQQIIILENCTATTAYFNDNQILSKGDNNTLITINNYRFSNNRFTGNNISSTGNNNTLLYYANTTSTSYVLNNNMKSYTTESTTAVVIDNARVRFNTNTVIVNTTQGEVPIVKVITTTNGQTNNNYLESLDLTGNDAVESPGPKTGNTPTGNDYRSKITITNETLIPTVETQITINVTDLLDNQIDGIITAQINNEEVTVENNMITFTPETLGEYTLKVTYTDPNEKYATNTITQTLKVEKQDSTTTPDNETLILGDSTNITATFYSDEGIPVNGGRAIFRVNGKTLRDDDGNVIYVNVTNGKAELPNVNITSEWTKPDTTIQAVYIGDNNNEPIITEATKVNVTKPEATITLVTPTEATAGTTITLKATVNDGDTAINSGRVAFKLNGKTLKDPKTGKALYANVENGEATITYTIPEKTKAKEYVLTAVFTDNNYDRKEAESKLNVVKA